MTPTVDGIWSFPSLYASVVLAGAIILEVLAGIEMKRACGFRNRGASVRGIGLVLACVCCCITVLNEVELSLTWAVYTVFEVAGLTLAGVTIWKEELNAVKLIGLLFALVGCVLLDLGTNKTIVKIPTLDHLPTPAPTLEKEVTPVNLPVLSAILVTAQVLAYWWGRRGHDAARAYVRLSEGTSPRSEDDLELHKDARTHETVVNAFRGLLLYGGLALATITEILLANCMKRSQGFEDLQYTLAAFGIGFINAIITIIVLDQSTLVVAWMLYTAFEYVGVLMLAVLTFHEPINGQKMAALALTAIGVVILIMEEESSDDDSDEE
eukprot:CAMPEP_0206558276 /NCGR_PEP_ID=MMETSP0325_2-20121206/19655_1 /ASSEMBLY_ACC=CAM_ASM_000347 /TAXON_ID=2866 /ORGANISM="Crypthecodinium cohnii, Strain Seligo" /LENGTH=323 /DNA_ID=CAMNT_0054059461 /DNA_START=55 /DNA_END=1026 /DNA_ORIENTATION=-